MKYNRSVYIYNGLYLSSGDCGIVNMYDKCYTSHSLLLKYVGLTDPSKFLYKLDNDFTLDSSKCSYDLLDTIGVNTMGLSKRLYYFNMLELGILDPLHLEFVTLYLACSKLGCINDKFRDLSEIISVELSDELISLKDPSTLLDCRIKEMTWLLSNFDFYRYDFQIAVRNIMESFDRCLPVLSEISISDISQINMSHQQAKASESSLLLYPSVLIKPCLLGIYLQEEGVD